MTPRGRLIGVVGPSGVGKDTVMQALAGACPGLGLVRRVITRSGGAIGEDCEVVSGAEFEARRARGEFALHWQAHDLGYGVPREIDRQLSTGKDLLVNLSRTVLLDAQDRFPGFMTLVLTAPHEVLRARLLQRKRESLSEITARLERRNFETPKGLKRVIEIHNEGCLDDTVKAARAALYPENEHRVT
jgi:ribose 1,5-bisphosphokinase